MTKKNRHLTYILVLFLLGVLIALSIHIVVSAINEDLGISVLTNKYYRTEWIVFVSLSVVIAALAVRLLKRPSVIDESDQPNSLKSTLSTNQSIKESSIDRSDIQTVSGDRNKQIIGKNKGDIYAGDAFFINSPIKTTPPDAKFLLPKGFNDARKLDAFTSRNDELALMSERLIQNRSLDNDSIICIVGPSGVGKSALACYFARKFRYT